MIRQGLVQVVVQEPPHAEPIGRQAQELVFGANALKEHYELQAKEDLRINAWPSQTRRIAVLHRVAHEGEIEHTVQVAVDVVGGDMLLQRDTRQRSEQARFGAHHETTSMGRLLSRGAGSPVGVRAIYRGI